MFPITPLAPPAIIFAGLTLRKPTPYTDGLSGLLIDHRSAALQYWLVDLSRTSQVFTLMHSGGTHSHPENKEYFHEKLAHPRHCSHSPGFYRTR